MLSVVGIVSLVELVCLVGFLTSQLGYVEYGSQTDVWQFYVLPQTRQSEETMTDTDPTSRERAATEGFEPRTPSPGVECSTV